MHGGRNGHIISHSFRYPITSIMACLYYFYLVHNTCKSETKTLSSNLNHLSNLNLAHKKRFLKYHSGLRKLAFNLVAKKHGLYVGGYGFENQIEKIPCCIIMVLNSWVV